MATKGIEIHALESKIRVIAEVLYDTGKIPVASRAVFARFVEINYDSLKTAWSKGLISAELEERIARAADFDTSDVAWVDGNVAPKERSKADGPEYSGRDSVSEFRSMLRRHHGLGPETVRILNERPHLIDSNFATFTVEDAGQGTTLDGPAMLFLNVVLEPGYHSSGLAYGFQRVRLRLRFDVESRTRIKERSGAPATKIRDAILSVQGSDHHSEWFLHVEDDILNGEYTTTSNPLCSLVSFRMGEEFKAELSVRLHDGTLIRQGGAPLLDVVKKRIIERLLAQRLPGAMDSHGWLSLGIQTLRVVRADRE